MSTAVVWSGPNQHVPAEVAPGRGETFPQSSNPSPAPSRQPSLRETPKPSRRIKDPARTGLPSKGNLSPGGLWCFQAGSHRQHRTPHGGEGEPGSGETAEGREEGAPSPAPSGREAERSRAVTDEMGRGWRRERNCIGAVGLGEGTLQPAVGWQGVQVPGEPPGALGLPWRGAKGRERSRGELTTAVLPAGLSGG